MPANISVSRRCAAVSSAYFTHTDVCYRRSSYSHFSASGLHNFLQFLFQSYIILSSIVTFEQLIAAFHAANNSLFQELLQELTLTRGLILDNAQGLGYHGM